jgi:adenine C2-methylase RlmN of 23S rRNA A2503 and tRNA A37
MEKIKQELETAGFDFAVAVATQAEIDANAACGQLAMVVEADAKQG